MYLLRKCGLVLVILIILGNQSVLAAKLTLGNSNSNIANKGLAAESNGWIYYCFGESKLYKIKSDGTQKTIIANVPAYNINIVGNYVFFSKDDGIFKVNINGKEKPKKVSSSYCRSMIVQNDWIYYQDTDLKGKYNIFKIKTNGKLKMNLTNDSKMSPFNKQGFWPSGSNDSGFRNFAVLGSWIYYIAQDGIYKIDTNGKHKQRLSTNKCWYIEANGNYIYYVGENNSKSNGKFFKMNLDGKNISEIKLANSENYYPSRSNRVNIVGDSIYYLNELYSNENSARRHDQYLYKMKLDGSENVKINESKTEDMSKQVNAKFMGCQGILVLKDRIYIEFPGKKDVFLFKEIRF